MIRLAKWMSPLVLLFIYGLYLSWFDLTIIEPDLQPQNPPGYFDYHGVTHVHSDVSIGSGGRSSIIAAAQLSNLDFLFFTELNNFAVTDPVRGYHDKILVFESGEYSFLDSHLLYYDDNTVSDINSLGQMQVYLTDLLSQPRTEKKSSMVVLAHPFRDSSQFPNQYHRGIGGIEVIDLTSIVRKAWKKSPLSVLWSLLTYPFNSQLALLRIYEDPLEELRFWDKLNEKEKVVGLAGNDAMAKAVAIGPFKLKFPSYKTNFEIVSNHVLLNSELTGIAENDHDKIMEALRLGHSYMALDFLANPKGFVAEVRKKDERHLIGSTVPFTKGLQLYVSLSKKPRVPFEVVVYRNGEKIMTSNSRETTMDIHSRGVYRVIVRVIPFLPLPDGNKWIPWIYTNPVIVN